MPERPWILRDYSLCSGCGLCEIACSLRHEGTFWREASRVRVIELFPGVTIPYMCVQCPDYPCVKSCPTGALKVREDLGAVVVDEGLCTLCGKCVNACPGKVPKVVKGKSSVIICDLCGGDPECVKVCELVGFKALKLTKHPGEAVKSYLVSPEVITKYYLRSWGVDS